jgi:hypothetical protein
MVFSIDPDTALLRGHDAGNIVKQRTFPAAAGAYDGNELAFIQVNADIVEDKEVFIEGRQSADFKP